jgi:hypothetical protein
MSKNSVLLPEPLPDFLVSLCVWAGVSPRHEGLTRFISPDIIERIESFLDIASGKTEEQMRSTERSLGINQVLVNEYQPGQGISVSKPGSSTAYTHRPVSASRGRPSLSTASGDDFPRFAHRSRHSSLHVYDFTLASHGGDHTSFWA